MKDKKELKIESNNKYITRKFLAFDSENQNWIPENLSPIKLEVLKKLIEEYLKEVKDFSKNNLNMIKIFELTNFKVKLKEKIDIE